VAVYFEDFWLFRKALKIKRSPALIGMSCQSVIPIAQTTGERVTAKLLIAATLDPHMEYANFVMA